LQPKRRITVKKKKRNLRKTRVGSGFRWHQYEELQKERILRKKRTKKQRRFEIKIGKGRICCWGRTANRGIRTEREVMWRDQIRWRREKHQKRGYRRLQTFNGGWFFAEAQKPKSKR